MMRNIKQREYNHKKSKIKEKKKSKIKAKEHRIYPKVLLYF